MPLLGNPTAAVLYPGKLIFAVAAVPVGGAALRHRPHAAGVRGDARAAAVVGDELDGLGARGAGYAFGAPILFQYCNIIFLVGAAWLPLGFRAVDRWLRLGRRVGAARAGGRAGDADARRRPASRPTSLGLCAGGLRRWRSPGASERGAVGQARSRGGSVARPWSSALVVWVVGDAGRWPPGLPAFRPPRPPEQPPLALPWMRLGRAWRSPRPGALAGLRPARALAATAAWQAAVLVPMLAGLVAAAVLAAGARGGAALARPRVHRPERPGGGRGAARHLPVQPGAAPGGRVPLAQRLRHRLPRQPRRGSPLIPPVRQQRRRSGSPRSTSAA